MSSVLSSQQNLISIETKHYFTDMVTIILAYFVQLLTLLPYLKVNACILKGAMQFRKFVLLL